MRKAANLAIDRDGLVNLLGGTGGAGEGNGHAWSSVVRQTQLSTSIRHRCGKALLKDAGFGPDNPCRVKFLISTAGSGQMQPLPMNEFIQENLKDVGFEVTLDAMDWEALRARRRGGVEMPENRGADALNNSWSSPIRISA